MDFIDLRSDTVTKPTPAMRQAMAQAEVGDDVYGEDPTVNRLQEMAAEMLGKEAGLFVTSGTMGNLAGILAHCKRGDEVILGNKAHTFLFEAGGISALGGVHSCQLPNQPDGTLLLEDIEAAIRPDDPHDPITRLVTLENTHNRCGGVALSPEYTRAVGELAHAQRPGSAPGRGAPVQCGGCARRPGARADRAGRFGHFLPEQGLCAPVGSVLCGSHDFIHRAHRIRKQLGGGMRQAGILAAAGIVALETMVDRLAEDHARARRLAAGLAEIPGLVLDPGSPHTNMIFIGLTEEVPLTTEQVAERLEGHGVKVGAVAARRFRLVTHYWIDDLAVERTAQAFNQVLRPAM